MVSATDQMQFSASRLIKISIFVAALQLLIFFLFCKITPDTNVTARVCFILADLAALTFFSFACRLFFREKFVRAQLGKISQTAAAHEQTSLELGTAFNQINKIVEESQQEEILLCEFAPDVLFVMSESGIILSINQTVLRQWSLPPAAATGRDLASLVASDQMKQLQDLIVRAKNSNAAISDEFRMKLPKRSQAYSKIVLEWSDTLKTFFCVASDISEKKMIENMKHEYMSMLTHDLRAPLAALTMTLETLQDGLHGQLNQSAHRSLDSGMKGLSHLSELINKLVLLDQSEAGELKLQKRMYPLSDLVDESIALLKPIADKSSIKLVSTLEEWIVWCDKSTILQVLNNLIANAIRYSPQNGEIVISGTAKMQELEISVSDSGPGVADIMKGLVFERYKTVEEASYGKSSGLGLAVCKAIVSAHGGEIGVRDRTEGGAVFFFTLSLASTEEIG